jgi:hypothetical protein
MTEVLLFAELPELAAGEAEVVVVAAGGAVQRGTEPLLLGLLLLAVVDLEEAHTGLLGFVAGDGLLGDLVKFFDKGHKVLFVEAKHIDFEEAVGSEGLLDEGLELALGHAAVVGDFEDLEVAVEERDKLSDGFEELQLRDGGVVEFEFERGGFPEVLERGDDVGDILDVVPGDVEDQLLELLDRGDRLEEHVGLTLVWLKSRQSSRMGLLLSEMHRLDTIFSVKLLLY